MSKQTHRDMAFAYQRKGTALVLVLGVTALVGVIGLSSLLAVRLEHQSAQLRTATADATRLASAGLEIVFERLRGDSSWRTRYTSGAWSTPATLGRDRSLQFQLVDEKDGNLSNVSGDPVVLRIRAVSGKAVRRVRVELRSDERFGPELVTNSSAEDGVENYSIEGGAGILRSSGADPFIGRRALEYAGRSNATQAIHQVIGVSAGQRYRVEAAVRLANSSAPVRIGFSAPLLFIPQTVEFTAAGTTQWKRVQGDLTPNFLLAPRVMVYVGTTTTTQAFWVDQLSVRTVSQEPLRVVRGSYRVEADG